MGTTGTAGNDAGGADRSRSRPGRWVVAGVGVLAVALVLGAAWWRGVGVDVLQGNYGSRTEQPVGRTLYAGLLPARRSAEGTMGVGDIEPRVRRNDARARIDYWVCDVDGPAAEGAGVVGFGVGGQREVDRLCSRLRAAPGATLGLRADPPQELVVAVTPTRPGVVSITGHVVSYRIGWRRGEEELPVALRIRARAGR